MAMLHVRTSEGEITVVPRDAALLSTVLREMLAEDEDDQGENVFTVIGVTKQQLVVVMEWCAHHVDDVVGGTWDSEFLKRIDDHVKWWVKDVATDPHPYPACVWDADFIRRNSDHTTLFDLMFAANFLAVEPLLNLACAELAKVLKNSKNLDEIYTTFSITPPSDERKAQIRAANEWVYTRDTVQEA